MFWLVVIVVIAVSVALLVMQQRGMLMGSQQTPQLPSLKRNVFNLQIGDIVEYMGRDWVVEGSLTYDVENYLWIEYMLQDGSDIRWLSVEEDDRVEVAFLESNHTLELSETPPQQIQLAGETYKQVDSGVATMTRQGTIVRRKGETCRYYDYEGADQKVLSIEFWQGDLEVTVGEKISPRSLILLPGDGHRVYGNSDLL